MNDMHPKGYDLRTTPPTGHYIRIHPGGARMGF